MTPRRLILTLFFTVLVVVGLYFLRTSKDHHGLLPGRQESQFINTFHPDSVVGFQWKTKAKSLAFTRTDRDQPWKPAVLPQTVQERLNLIAIAPYQPLTSAGEPKLTLTIAFGEKNQWDGAWDGKYFVWTTGNFKDQGFEVSERDQPKFEAGALSFEKKDLNWCPQRLKVLEVQSGPLKFKLYQAGLNWILNEKMVDPTFVEQWLGRACSNRLEEHIDKNITTDKYHFDGTLNADFVGGKSIAWKIDPGAPAFADGESEFLSPSLDTQLKELMKAPIIGNAPPPAEVQATPVATVPAPVKSKKVKKK